MITLVLIFLVGVVASFAGAIAGGTSIISLPILIFLGLPPHIAVGTNRIGVLGLALSSAYKFLRSDKIVWHYAFPMSLIATVMGICGSAVVVSVDAKTLSKSLGMLMLLLLMMTLFSGRIGISRAEPTLRSRILGYVLVGVLSFVAAFLGGGVGAAMFLALMMTFGLTILEANATYSIPLVFLTVASLYTFILADTIDYLKGGVLFCGMFIGGYGGTHTALLKGDRWVRKVFVAMSIFLSCKLIYSSFSN